MMQVPPGESLLAGSRDWVLWFTVAALVVALAALLSIWLGRRHSRQAKWVWTVIVVAFPIVGGLGWFLLAREPRDRTR